MDLNQLAKVVAPEFACDDRFSAALTLAALEVSPTHCYRDKVVVLLAAHMLAMADRSALASGPVSSMSEGGLSISFAGGSNMPTPYGNEIRRLNRLCYGITAMTGWEVPDA